MISDKHRNFPVVNIWESYPLTVTHRFSALYLGELSVNCNSLPLVSLILREFKSVTKKIHY